MDRLKAWWANRVNRSHDPAWRLYRAIAVQAVTPERLASFGLEDTPENRFELLALHLAAGWVRMDAGADTVRRMRVQVGEAFVADMDASLRDMGAGDLGVGKRVKALTERLYGRFAGYAPALADGAADSVIDEALARNLYKEGAPSDNEASIRARVAAHSMSAAWRNMSDESLQVGEAPEL
jgi:cytochrome b pre-mRNA-processing protein 3